LIWFCEHASNNFFYGLCTIEFLAMDTLWLVSG
jgi:hypothetical protein